MCRQCEHQGQHCGCGGQGSDCGCDCGDCDNQSQAHRRYQTKAEKITELESYLSDLKLEVQAVEEHLADLRK